MTPLSLVIVSVCFGGALGSFPICHFFFGFPPNWNFEMLVKWEKD